MKYGPVVVPLLVGASLLACSGRANPGIDFQNRDGATTSDAAATPTDNAAPIDNAAPTDNATPTIDVASDVPASVDVPVAPDAGASVDVPAARDVGGVVDVGVDVSTAVDVPVVADVGAPVDTGVDAPTATDEVCGNGVDDDRDGRTDEGCRVLAAFAGCPSTMYAVVALDEEFDSTAVFATRWNPSYVAPTLSSGGLVFGPHPLTANWWENYSPVASRQNFGDAMLCAHLTLTPANTAANTGTVELSLRGVSEGMVVSVRSVDGDVLLQTKRPDGSWLQHANAPMAFTRGARQTVDVVLWASGDRFRAEVRNQTSGAIVALNVRYTLPSTGVAGMLGWMLGNPARVERLQVGTPSDAVRRVFENPDY